MKTCFVVCVLSALSGAAIINVEFQHDTQTVEINSFEGGDSGCQENHCDDGSDDEEDCVCTLEHEPVFCEDGNEYMNACFAACNNETDCSPVDDDGDDEEDEDVTPPEPVNPPSYNLPCNTQLFTETYGCEFVFESYQDMLDHYDMDNNVCPEGTGDIC